jgi:hypothetical protein
VRPTSTNLQGEGAPSGMLGGCFALFLIDAENSGR